MLAKLKGLFTTTNDIEIDINNWNENGFLILKGLFNKAELDDYNNNVDNIIKNRVEKSGNITIDVLEGSLIGQRLN